MKRKAKNPQVARSIAAAATAIGVSQRTLGAWLAAGAPGERGKYDVEAIRSWREVALKPVAAKDTAGLAELRRRQLAASADREELQAERERLRLASERNELIEVAVAASIISQHAAEVRAHLDQLPEFASSLVKLEPGKKKEFLSRMASKVRDICEGLESAAKEMAEKAEAEE